jgi:hypothetical protein
VRMRGEGGNEEEETETGPLIMLYSSVASVQRISAISVLACLHSHYRVSSQCFCSGSSRWSTPSAASITLRAYRIPRKSRDWGLVQYQDISHQNSICIPRLTHFIKCKLFVFSILIINCSFTRISTLLGLKYFPRHFFKHLSITFFLHIKKKPFTPAKQQLRKHLPVCPDL